MKRINVKIKGIAPMLMHSDRTANPLDEYTKKLKAVTSKRKKTDEDYEEISKIEFEASLYYSKEQGYYMPASNIEACMLASAKQFKLGTTIKQCLLVTTDGSFTFKDNDLAPQDLYSIPEYVDMRTVKVGQSKTVRTRPIFFDWVVKFDSYLDTDKMNEDDFKMLIENAGKYIGFGDYRPRYGRFELKEFSTGSLTWSA